MKASIGAEAGDLPALAALASAAGYPAYDLASLTGSLERGALLLTTIDRDGFALVEIVADEAELHLIVVAPAARRAGLARALLADALDAARSRGARRIFLEVAAANLPAIGLYRGAGMAEVGRRRAYYRDGQDALLFALTLG